MSSFSLWISLLPCAFFGEIWFIIIYLKLCHEKTAALLIKARTLPKKKQFICVTVALLLVVYGIYSCLSGFCYAL